MKTKDYLDRENDLLEDYLLDMNLSGGLYQEYQKVSKKPVKMRINDNTKEVKTTKKNK